MRPALVIIDAQNEYFKPYGKRVLPEGEKALVQVISVLRAARTANLPVFHVVHHALSPSTTVYRPGEPGAGIHPAIEVLPGETIITKHFPGSFTQTPLEAHLKQSGIDTLVISGFMTHMCCDTTTRQAKERGFDVIFLSDATASHDLKLGEEVVSHEVVHHATLAIMASFGAKVMKAQEVISLLGV